MNILAQLHSWEFFSGKKLIMFPSKIFKRAKTNQRRGFQKAHAIM